MTEIAIFEHHIHVRYDRNAELMLPLKNILFVRWNRDYVFFGIRGYPKDVFIPRAPGVKDEVIKELCGVLLNKIYK